MTANKKFLTTTQIGKLKERKWNIMENGIYVDIYRDEIDEVAWEFICKQTDSVVDCDKITLLSVASKVNK